MSCFVCKHFTTHIVLCCMFVNVKIGNKIQFNVNSNRIVLISMTLNYEMHIACAFIDLLNTNQNL